MKTRYILYPLVMLLAILLPTSCSFEEDIIDVPTSDDEKVNLTLGVKLAGATSVESRAFADGDEETGNNNYYQFENLYLAVFEEIGGVYTYKELINLTPNDENGSKTLPTWDSTNSCWKYNVSLTKTTNKCRVHLIANYPGLTMGMGDEGRLIGLLETKMIQSNSSTPDPEHDAYWNYFQLSDIDANTSLPLVTLVRNYAKVALVNNNKNTNFTYVGYKLCYLPSKGTIAAYNTASDALNPFAQFVASDGTCQSYDYMTNTENYAGNDPFDASLIPNAEDEGWTEAVSYMYERKNTAATSNRPPTCIIIKGTWKENSSDEGTPTYYKLDFVDQSGNNYNILRNFEYTMTITGVTGEGYTSLADALREPACNNINGDVKIANYTNVSDGTSQFYVSATTIVFTQDKNVAMYYKYIPDIDSPSKTSDNVTYLVKDDNNILTSISTAELVNDANDPYNGWYKVTLTPNYRVIPGGATGTITFTASTAEKGTLKRTVNLIMRAPYEFVSVDVPENVAPASKEPFDVKITLPGGINPALFPLRLFISSEKNTIFPAYGQDMPADSQNGKYGFIKEISLNEYNSSTTKEFTCNFLTNCISSATSVKVENDYFKDKSDSFGNNAKITSLSIAVGNPVTIQQEAITTGGMMGFGGTTTYYYPEIIQGGNDEEVKVTINGVEKVFYIDENGVTTANNVVWNNTNGFNPEDVLTFTFNDKYRNNRGWSSNTVIYTATCKVGDLKNGTTLEFKRQQ